MDIDFERIAKKRLNLSHENYTNRPMQLQILRSEDLRILRTEIQGNPGIVPQA